MATKAEVRRWQNERLFDLLKLKRDNDGVEIKGLDNMIAKARLLMPDEDVAWVERCLDGAFLSEEDICG